MTTDLIDQTLGNLACSVPGAPRVFRQFRLDFCCGGDLSLREAAQRIEADPQHIADALLALEPDAEDRDWRSMPAGQLIEYILARFHERHRDQLPELIRLASRVEQVHGSKPGCPNGLAEHLWNMQQELESHMLKEEQILFPMLQTSSVWLKSKRKQSSLCKEIALRMLNLQGNLLKDIINLGGINSAFQNLQIQSMI